MWKKIAITLLWIFLILLYLLHAIINGACDWYNLRFGVTFEEILFTITSPLAGADVSFLNEAVTFTLPYVYKALPVLVILLVLLFCLRKTKKHIRILYTVLCSIFIFALLIDALYFAVKSLSLDDYIARKTQSTTIYEDYYVDPETAKITPKDQPKNLIYIYIESMETTYASTEVGGAQDVNYIPKLTQLATENTSFSDTELLGGAYVPMGASWTMAALFATSSGVPFSFPADNDTINKMGIFAPGITTLGDLLNNFGYTQKFLCGSDGNFAGRKIYYEQHGNFEIQDYFYAVEQGYIPEDYYVWWGYEDTKLYEIAKTELLKLSEESAPFNYTMLTVDTHHVDGYICENCKDTYDHQLGNVLECTDSQIYDFILWCQQQDFYEDTVIVITGDHFRMDSSLVADKERRLYNCIINSDTTVEGSKTNRLFTSLDLFPTTLSALGFEIEGDRLGLGTDLYSSTPTLCEELGGAYFMYEIGKYSQYYLDNFQ